MQLHLLQRDIQGLQSQVIALRGEKDEEHRKEKALHLYNRLVELAHGVKELYK